MDVLIYILGIIPAFACSLEFFRLHNLNQNENFSYKKDDLIMILTLSILFSSLSWFTVLLICLCKYTYSYSDKILNFLNSEKSIFDIIKEKMKK